MSKPQSSPQPRLVKVGVSVSALALFVASAAALLTQSCTETSAPKKPTNGMATSPDAPTTGSATTPTPPTAPTNLPPPPT